MKTSDKLKTLFDYQEFVKDSDLICMKADAENVNCVLTDDELAMASGGSPTGVLPIIFAQAQLVGVVAGVNTANGIVKGNVVDVKGAKVLVDSVGWVDIKDTDLCQQ